MFDWIKRVFNKRKKELLRENEFFTLGPPQFVGKIPERIELKVESASKQSDFKGWMIEKIESVVLVNPWCAVPQELCVQVRKRNSVTQWFGFTREPVADGWKFLRWEIRACNPFRVLLNKVFPPKFKLC